MPQESTTDFRVKPLDEQWPNLRFLGLGAWWAWIWLCYSSTTVVGLFPSGARLESVLEMYLFSTPAIAVSMLIAAAVYYKVEKHVKRRVTAVVFGGLATLATLLLEFSGAVGSPVLFAASAVLTGVGTSYLCLLVGRIYGSVGLGESLSAAALSLVFAALLYFTGVSLPGVAGPLFAAVLPMLSALMLSMKSDDTFMPARGALPPSADEVVASKRALRRVAAAAGVIAFTAGVAKGVMSLSFDGATFAEQSTVSVLVIGLVGVAILFAIGKCGAVRAITGAYTALMVAGIAMMLACCVGFDISYLVIGKETLWLILSVLMAYLAFRYSISAVRVFGIGQAVYFLCSSAGWLVGMLVAPLYAQVAAFFGITLGMAFLIVLTLVYLLPAGEVGDIVKSAHADYAEGEAVAAADGVALRSEASQPSLHASVSSTLGDEGEMAGAAGATETDGASTHSAGVTDTIDGAKASETDASSDAAPKPHPGVAPACDPRRERYGRAAEPLYGLSDRELEIMELFAQGRSANWIAENRCISKNTVRTHLRSVYAKLDIHTRQELLDFLAK
ncbi:MAG: helix-turn-helix domain-containing protein [Eggerthellaceae bacterium]|nr:helix-turn-helix domain-containing protein [Eggerthellaceae bacterium]